MESRLGENISSPLIGIVGKHDEKRESIGQSRRYIDAVTAAGGLPVIIPPVIDSALTRAFAERVDGILLPGSSTDVDPAIYGAERHPKLGHIYVERDAIDLELFKYADTHSVPAMGICFGVQSLNVSRGGSLVQDIPALLPAAVPHSLKDEEGGPARHTVRFEDGTLLAELAGARTADVNSYHHQAIDRLGAGLRASAIASDGVIEAVEDAAGRFIIGVQWHPEQDWERDPLSAALFGRFIEHAREFRNSRAKRAKQR
jgi:putative glutamine amidotransferase